MNIFTSVSHPFESGAGVRPAVSGADVWRGLPAFPESVTEADVGVIQAWINKNSSRIVLLTRIWPGYVPGPDWDPRQGPVFPVLLISGAASLHPNEVADMWVSWLLR